MPKVLKESLAVLKPIYRKIRANYWALRAKKLGEIPTKETSAEQVVLFVLPEAGINLNIKTVVMVASQLTLQNVKVYFTRCFNLFDRCLFMDSESFPLNASAKEKKILCTYCFRSFEKNVIENGLDFIDLRHFVQDLENTLVESILHISSGRPNKVIYDGINFSGLLEYNLFLYLKKASLDDLTQEELTLWQQQASYLIKAYIAIKNLIKAVKISHIVMFEQYSLNAIVHILAQRSGIKFANMCLPFHKDVDASKIRILLTDSYSQEFSMIKNWKCFKNLALSPMRIKEITDDLILKMSKRGIFTYSPSKTPSLNLFEKLNLSKSRKTIVAYTSSPDEADSVINFYERQGTPLPTPDDAFNTQIEWLDELISFVENSSNFQLIIRVHPRMAPNHREKWGCQAIVDFKKRYARNYANVKIIWPEDTISSFDLAEFADVATIAWSTMGIFMARLGVPVVSGIKLSLPLPNEPFHVFCNTKENYFKSLIRLSEQMYELNHLKHAYRWYQMFYLGYCIDLNDVIEEDNRKFKILSKNAAIVRRALIDHENVLDFNLNELRREQKEMSQIDESIELKKQLKRLIHFFMVNEDNCDNDHNPMKVFFKKENNVSSSNAIENSILVEDNWVEYCYDGNRYCKYSPLIKRLAIFTNMIENNQNIIL